MQETGGIPQEANASGNAEDMQTWGELSASGAEVGTFFRFGADTQEPCAMKVARTVLE
ncbi:hypothetical protein [Kamptonema formosum]|uniref:hypothetical protein n=1 Tax=Kamptonema formosum TaxID=331992 RepID=UPI000346DC7E|nr:hypothetical protein [Oscillatoria sp. PCC 10802]